MSKAAEEFYLKEINPDNERFKNDPIHRRVIKLMESFHAYELSKVEGLPSDEEYGNGGEMYVKRAAKKLIAKKDAIIEIVTSSRDILSIENGELHRELAKVLIELNKAKEEIDRLKDASIKLFNMVHESDLIENKIKANDLYDIIK